MSDTIYNIRTFVADNGKVVLELTSSIPGAGKAIDMPWEKADELSRALTIQARRCEEYCKANEIIMDNALLQRSGANIGLSDRADINGETVKEALQNKGLRRLLPWRQKNVSQGIEGIRTRGVVGSPALTKHKPN